MPWGSSAFRATHRYEQNLVDSQDTPSRCMWCQSIIESNLAACVNMKRINSVFRWEGEIQNASEWDIQIKTHESSKNGLISKIKSEHSYDLPQIVWWSVESTVEYYNWVQG